MLLSQGQVHLHEDLALRAVSADTTARVWDMEIGDCVLLLWRGTARAISNVAAAADGSLLITTSGDGSARVWELEKGECLAVLLGHTAPVLTWARQSA